MIERIVNLPLKDIGPEPTSNTPQLFVRAIVVPPGAPWEQARAAGLEARHGAPLPIGELMHQVRRLSPWSPGRPGRYAVFYLRAQEYREPFETALEVDGQPVKVAFGTPIRQLAGLQRVGIAVGALVAAGAVIGGGVTLALSAQAQASTRLEAAEALAAADLKAAQAARTRREEMGDVRILAAAARPLDDILGDLAWIATSKTPEGRIVGVHWEAGLLAVEARGEQPPFLAVDRPLQRADKPVRPGVWLWAVARTGGTAAASGPPVSAELRP